MDRITMENALSLIDTGKVCSLKYVTYDKKRKIGGKIKSLEQAIVTRPKSTKSLVPSKKKNGSQNHFDNSTRNFQLCINGKPTSAIRKLHVFLIIEINGKQIML